MAILTQKPDMKYFPELFRAIKYALITKITSQYTGSDAEGIQNTVASPIANPKSDNWKINFKFITIYFIKDTKLFFHVNPEIECIRFS